MPCDKDGDTQRYTHYKKEPQMRCVAKGNATAKVLILGNSIAYKAYPLIHNILKGRYRSLRLYAKSGCPSLSNWCADFTKATRKVVQHEKPDIIMYMHHSTYAPFIAPVEDLSKDRISKEFQGNLDFISNYTKHIIIDMIYYTSPFNVGAKLARRLQLGLSPGDEFIATWEQHINKTRYHQLRLSSLNCSKCITNNINEALFKNGLFHLYDPDTLLARLGDGIHMTPVGLELLRPLYTKILENLLQRLTI
ncbi:unnamed protein product [Cylicocyclus nassatus]|uniref:SGNH domain-containing protein n=1 Tax=Cylicocyclus nassatus TaxID=53992 RepID=A0AA36M9V0_CYLNA|nr:unnamed protein product [Cylicocyclus nassatus]